MSDRSNSICGRFLGYINVTKRSLTLGWSYFDDARE